MKNLEIIPTAPRRVGRPKKILDHQKLDSIVEVLPGSPVELLETFLIFDARCLDRETQQELLRILPQLIRIRQAWKAEYMECGCHGCQKPDPTITIAARLRRRGSTWAEIYEITAPNITSYAQRKRFRSAVLWKLEHLDASTRKPSPWYGAGGLCDACCRRIGARMRNRYRTAMTGRDLTKEFATFKDALCLRYNTAQRLFNGED